MKFTETNISGAYVIDLEMQSDDRGFFARVWCQKELEKLGLNSSIAQCNISYNKRKGTVRGLHYQKSPFEEIKMVRCIQGAVFDVVVDLRRDSPSYLQYFSVELSAKNRRALYVPKGCAHGYQALEDDTEVIYFCSEFYHPKSETSVRWDDSAFNILWPEVVTEISEKDSAAEDWQL